MPFIKKRGNSWVVITYVGNERRRWQSFKTEAEARQAAAKIEVVKRSGRRGGKRGSGRQNGLTEAEARIYEAFVQSGIAQKILRRGMPDFWVQLADGSAWAVEVKARGDDLKSVQQEAHAFLAAIGVRVMVIQEFTSPELRDIMQALDEEARRSVCPPNGQGSDKFRDRIRKRIAERWGSYRAMVEAVDGKAGDRIGEKVGGRISDGAGD